MSLCEEADRPPAAAASGGETLTCRRAMLGALAAQVEEVVAGLTARQASTPKLRFADTAARFGFRCRAVAVFTSMSVWFSLSVILIVEETVGPPPPPSSPGWAGLPDAGRTKLSGLSLKPRTCQMIEQQSMDLVFFVYFSVVHREKAKTHTEREI